MKRQSIFLERKIAHYKPTRFFVEINLWRKIGKALLPFLILTVFLSMQDSFFWTIGPLLSEFLTHFEILDGLFMTAYTLPTLIFGWFVDKFIPPLGGKKAGFVSFMISSIFLAALVVFKSPAVILVLVFTASIFSTISWSIEGGYYADAIEDHLKVEKEIEGLEDFAVNIGYIVGPALAGFLSDQIGYYQTFSALGAVSFFVALGLFLTRRKPIQPAV